MHESLKNDMLPHSCPFQKSPNNNRSDLTSYLKPPENE